MDQITVLAASRQHQAMIIEMLEEIRDWLKSKQLNQWPFPFTAKWVGNCLERQEFFIANSGNETIGVFRLLSTDPTFWNDDTEEAFYIHSLAVRRNWHGKGIGRYLLGWAEDYTARRQRLFLRLDCMAENPVLCRYYRNLGFFACGKKEIQYGQFIYKAQLFQKAVKVQPAIQPAA